ncbi:MAG: bifunctional acetaldehyde-CoA/alcohol dehydrogenase [Eubacteriales bacterium]|nr:bifunctional acetaldehyde-CoA/alcohol dehydrogenase [Bacillota bacterium]MBV1727171.1 bifunctional acetaldehyde-CoA/alcohol dehydrogenase [Desulforudis sp.]MDZ4041924.1 bifunctional acetaldehyde-CoA/alcohol dehydrogenase [Eubacteriales bacterium]MBU4533789.1 bifunctional acetaldehyde-CoA/alcohol dehydrogenase [Bacillota bacterium]MBU4554005.1 bifunctional acetaldehyde-CoA/alcohol dehydrogenase [Bacillota bacterium]
MPETDQQEIQQLIDGLVENARTAYREYLDMDQGQIDRIVQAAALAGVDRHMELARLALEETGRGIYEDKVIKNLFATEYIYHDIKYERTVGVIRDNEDEGYTEIAEPAGVIAALTPVTNPTSTTLFKGLIALKTRNPIIFSFHPSALRSSAASAEVLRDAAVKAGAPAHCIQWLTVPTKEASRALLHHPGVALILATGGEQMVRAAYSTGRPALGVGPGNVPCYIEQSANLRRAVNDLVLSKTFDNGMICASEQAVIVDRTVAREVRSLMEELGCYFAPPEEIPRLEALATCGEVCSLNPDVVGRSAVQIAEMAGITVPPDAKILVAEQGGVGREYPLSREKLSPILAYYEVEDYREGTARAVEMVSFGGLGHSAVIHTEQKEIVEYFSNRVSVGRIIVNAPASQGAIGDLYNNLTPSLTLGCGYVGHNTTTANVTALNLVTVKRVARRRVNMQWFKVPNRIYFESGALQYLTKMNDLDRVFIVTDPVLSNLGYVERVLRHLDNRSNRVTVEVFKEVEPNPSLETVQKGIAIMNAFRPDTIIALGGGSVIDAAKGMWLFYEHPEVEFDFLKLKFMDIRKRTYKYRRLRRKTQLVAIPTTSGSGSEVTAFAVITDRGRDIKYPLADYELTPDVAIIDVDLAMGQPPGLTVDAGMDVLTHAIEAYVSVMASDYTDALALKAITIVFEFLPQVIREPANREAREKMHNAATIAGMAFTNAFLGVNHALGHKLGGEFDLPHGRANAVLIPHVIAYNASPPTKLTAWPKYEYYKAPERYREIAKHLGLPAEDNKEGVSSLIAAVRDLMQKVGMPLSIQECGVNEQDFFAKLPLLAEQAFEDQTVITNPRQPLISELEEILRKAWG